MFEHFVNDPSLSNAKKKNRRLLNLISKYKELKKTEFRTKAAKSRRFKVLSKKKVLLKEAKNTINKREAPEETYEIWHDFENLNANLKKPVKSKTTDQNINNNDGIETNNIDTEKEEVSNYKEALQDFSEMYHQSTPWVKINLILNAKGLETLPNRSLNSGSDSSVEYSFRSSTKNHLENLKNLLHLSVLRRNWISAYKAFCLIVRFPTVDIRSIWPIGVEILQNMRSSDFQNSASWDSSSKDLKFFEWLSSFFVVSRNNNSTIFSGINTSAPIWRSGSKTHAPIYVVSYMWILLIQKKYSTLKDKLDDLLLEPPFSTNGIFYYIRALCDIMELANIVYDRKSVETNLMDIEAVASNNIGTSSTRQLQQQVNLLIISIEKLLKKCDDLEFLYSKNHIIDILDSFLTFLHKELDIDVSLKTLSRSSSLEGNNTLIDIRSMFHSNNEDNADEEDGSLDESQPSKSRDIGTNDSNSPEFEFDFEF